VTSVTFTYTDPDGNAHPAVFNPPAAKDLKSLLGY